MTHRTKGLVDNSERRKQKRAAGRLERNTLPKANAMRTEQPQLPGSTIEVSKMPGHWLLARLGKRVLRPGGIELTRLLLDALEINEQDAVVEFAPGLGITARITLGRNPSSYTAVERDETAAANVRRYLSGSRQTCVVASASATGLSDQCASVVYGEAMLTMQSEGAKRAIITEAARLLGPGGRYGIHEIALTPDDIDDSTREQLSKELTAANHHAVLPLTRREWSDLLLSQGLHVNSENTAPMHLLEPRRVIQDEGLGRTMKIAWNLARDRGARRRVSAMRRAFKKHAGNMMAIMLTAKKK